MLPQAAPRVSVRPTGHHHRYTAGSDAGALALLHVTPEGGQTLVPNVVVDTVAHTVQGDTSALGVFVLVTGGSGTVTWPSAPTIDPRPSRSNPNRDQACRYLGYPCLGGAVVDLR